MDRRTPAIGWNGGDARSDAETDVVKVAQLLHRGIYLSSIGSLRVEDGLGVVEKQDHDPRGQEGSQRSQIVGILNTGADGLGELGEEIGKGRREFVATNESAVITKSFLDAVVVKDGEGNSRFPDSPCTDESDGLELLGEVDDLLDQRVASEKRLRCWGR